MFMSRGTSSITTRAPQFWKTLYVTGSQQTEKQHSKKTEPCPLSKLESTAYNIIPSHSSAYVNQAAACRCAFAPLCFSQRRPPLSPLRPLCSRERLLQSARWRRLRAEPCCGRAASEALWSKCTAAGSSRLLTAAALRALPG